MGTSCCGIAAVAAACWGWPGLVFQLLPGRCCFDLSAAPSVQCCFLSLGYFEAVVVPSFPT